MNMKKILTLVLALALCVSMVACGGEEKKTAAKDEGYKVTVLDPHGNPMSSGVIVRVLKDGQQVAMQVADEQGVARLDLEDGDYTVELKFTDANAKFYYDPANLTLSANKTSLEIQLMNQASEGHSLFAPMLGGDSAETTAYTVTLGGNYITPTVDQRNYYLFTPTQSGTYTVQLTQGEGTVGYYGAPHFVQNMSALDVIEGVLTISVSPSMIGEGGATSNYVLGVDAKTDSGVLTIIRTGDHKHTIEDEPWTEYIASHTPTAFTYEPTAGKTLTYVDIYNGKAEDYPVVLGSDGFYHMGSEDGSLVYLNLSKEAPNMSFYLIIKGDGVAGGSPIREYYFNDNGDFVKKEDYTNLVLSYIECMDEKTGLYPLTADLVYVIQTRSGWWTSDSPDYIFTDCNPDIAWLFACCYEK